MTQDIVTLYVSLLSSFFTLSSSTHTPTPAASGNDLNATPPIPPFVPPVSNATTNCHWLLRVLNELIECVSELGALELAGEASQSLKELVGSARWRFEEAICSGWVRDAKVFYRLETWHPDPDDPSITAYLRQVAAFQRFNAISAYRVAGGSEERANALMGSSSASSSSSAGGALSSSRNRQDIDLPVEFQRKVQSAFLDGLYAFLDGLVHVAFSDPGEILGGVGAGNGTKGKNGGMGAGMGMGMGMEGEEDTGRPKEVDVRNVDIRILLTVSNLTHLRETTVPRLISQFQSAFKVDMGADVQMLMDVIDQLDKILFDDYVKRKSAEVAKIIRKGVLGGTVDWYEADKPTEVHPFIYDALLSLVLVHAQVSATAKPLVARTLGALVEELAQVALDAFGKVERFGMGGMLQATLEIEFMHQTLSQHVSPHADQTLQSIYKTISQSYYRRPTPNSAAELQQELEGLKRTLVASRRATALQFLCFRRASKAQAPQTATGQLADGSVHPRLRRCHFRHRKGRHRSVSCSFPPRPLLWRRVPRRTEKSRPGREPTASSTGLLLKTLGFNVTAIKIDPYMNIDAGTMSPTEHGEVFVLDDGGEADLDLGNYERYLNVTLGRDNNITTGKIYREVIEKERRGDYLGKTVQVIPHVTDAIQDWVERVAQIPVDESGKAPEVCIIELGGTVGDIESAPFVEAMRQFQFRVGHDNFALLHVSLVPSINGELKTKPTQASIRDLRGLGLTPDLVQLPLSVTSKISMFCHVANEQVLAVHDVSSLYHVPLLLKAQGLITFLEKRLKLDLVRRDDARIARGNKLMTMWKELTVGHDRLFDKVSIVLVGKYTSLQDSYTSVVKSLEHASMQCGRKLNITWVEASDLEPEAQHERPKEFHAAWQAVCTANKVLIDLPCVSSGILVPGGFGVRGTEGMIAAAKWAREKKVPYLGICLGFQIAVIEFARHVVGLKGAHSAELEEKTPHPVIIFMPEISKTHLGGTMRLGLRPTIFQPKTEWSKVRQLYGGAETIWERHRHRYEVNPAYVKQIEAKGLLFTGRDERGERMQVAELKDHPYFAGLQAHPEFCTRPLNPSPAYLGFIAASAGVLPEQIERQKSYAPPVRRLLPGPSLLTSSSADDGEIVVEPVAKVAIV
ncbi:SPOSA6832_00273 [Sporobolomyces salmonicolor]|uniref:CTP synthase n=1 Tax=Sporidiobolus salmonicolor TaxID=5005 RepID=A0A0D6EGW0_SPOSA|nr:SPOSA6832_00273 [Sporobolomyces salmonicolor]